MINLVECKRCGEKFDYSPGNAGNNPQVCSSCIKIIGEEELQKLMDESIIDGNKYLVGAPNRENMYDPFEIVTEGKLPELNNDADRFICASEVGEFLKNNGLCGYEDNVVNFLNYLDVVHALLCIKDCDKLTINQLIACNSFRHNNNITIKTLINK